MNLLSIGFSLCGVLVGVVSGLAAFAARRVLESKYDGEQEEVIEFGNGSSVDLSKAPLIEESIEAVLWILVPCSIKEGGTLRGGGGIFEVFFAILVDV